MNSDFVLAVHALVFLNHKNEELSSGVLAENICTNPVRVRRVMSRLCKAKMIENSGGRSGYRFVQKPEKVNLRMVADALDATFTSTNWHSGDPHMECRVASGMAGVADGIYEQMDSLCKAYLETVSIADIDQKLFGQNE
ncbi:Rrf2 family transcriptional regulator [Anaerotignum sp.]|uniref:Rrf2 family transcriptional regulator n=1 Tax=Anaerotignum sp. TaxID=2039241 RepID=UPI0028AA5C6B|nr:Rrf2 family transcriptional regulator [Anaerotignum sp.]